MAIVAGLLALFFREFGLPYCGIAMLLAAWHRRWLEAVAWGLGIAAFGAFLVWHIGQVRGQLAGSEVAAAAGLSQWLRFGGLDFVLLTTRMNSLLFNAPAVVLWLYLLVDSYRAQPAAGRNEPTRLPRRPGIHRGVRLRRPAKITIGA